MIFIIKILTVIITIAINFINFAVKGWINAKRPFIALSLCTEGLSYLLRIAEALHGVSIYRDSQVFLIYYFGRLRRSVI